MKPHPADLRPLTSDLSHVCIKHVYATKRDVQTFLNAYAKSSGRHGRPEYLRCYFCEECKGWHVTKGKALQPATGRKKK